LHDTGFALVGPNHACTKREGANINIKSNLFKRPAADGG
jgi:hypothetical protein